MCRYFNGGILVARTWTEVGSRGCAIRVGTVRETNETIGNDVGGR